MAKLRQQNTINGSKFRMKRIGIDSCGLNLMTTIYSSFHDFIVFVRLVGSVVMHALQ